MENRARSVHGGEDEVSEPSSVTLRLSAKRVEEIAAMLGIPYADNILIIAKPETAEEKRLREEYQRAVWRARHERVDA